MKITASAPGKLMLFGEHAVIHQHPCLVTAVDLRIYVSVEKIDAPMIFIETPKLSEQSFAVQINCYNRMYLWNTPIVSRLPWG